MKNLLKNVRRLLASGIKVIFIAKIKQKLSTREGGGGGLGNKKWSREFIWP